MKINMHAEEMYPVYYFNLIEPDEYAVDLPEELVKKYVQTQEELKKLSKEIENTVFEQEWGPIVAELKSAAGLKARIEGCTIIFSGAEKERIVKTFYGVDHLKIDWRNYCNDHRADQVWKRRRTRPKKA